MNTKWHLAVALFAGFALSTGNALASDGSGSRSHPEIPSADQPRVAEVTQNLENAFDKQFVDGKIDRDALAGPIDDVVNAMPEKARPVVKAHIELVLQTGEKLAPQMTPEERAEAASAPPVERVGKSQQAQIAAWGWPAFGGFGGFGAFGFPGIWGPAWGGWGGVGWGGAGWGGVGWGGWGGVGWGGVGWGGVGWGGAGWGGGWGCLGLGGWGW